MWLFPSLHATRPRDVTAPLRARYTTPARRAASGRCAVQTVTQQPISTLPGSYRLLPWDPLLPSNSTTP